ncbi:hypothetical protein KCU71_g6227, partial [Aureobasidium melanogenum]
MPTTPGHSALAGASLEEEAVRSVVGKKWTVKAKAYPTASQVLEEVLSSDIVHLACHGWSDPTDPAQSHLLLQNGEGDGEDKTVDRLTVSALLEANTKAASWIAYLSACSTAEVKMRALADESLHLTSAFQLAGFAHVIGSLRPADDAICVQVATHFYSYLVENENRRDRNRAVAEALNFAVRQIAKEHPDNPEIWAPFIHLGANVPSPAIVSDSRPVYMSECFAAARRPLCNFPLYGAVTAGIDNNNRLRYQISSHTVDGGVRSAGGTGTSNSIRHESIEGRGGVWVGRFAGPPSRHQVRQFCIWLRDANYNAATGQGPGRDNSPSRAGGPLGANNVDWSYP